MLLPVFLLAFLGGCARHEDYRAGPNAKRYELRGTVVSVDQAGGRVTVSHEAVAGLMDAMTMPFRVKEAWALDVMKPGYKVQATLVIDGGRSWIEQPVITQAASVPAIAQYTPVGGGKPGDEVPAVPLINQDAKTTGLGTYRGRALVITFIYTRCPLPDYCPLMNQNLEQLDRLLASDGALYARTHLMSISFDPEHDTPRVLRDYGAPYAARPGGKPFAHWEFATGNRESIDQLAKFFGFAYSPQDGLIAHSLSTALIGPDGRLIRIYGGNEWKPAQVLADIQKIRF